MSQSERRSIRILTVDDHPALRDGISAIVETQPDMEVVGEAEDGRGAIERFRALRPDITLMDLQMPNLDGVEAIIGIRQHSAAARVIVLTTYHGDVLAARALRAGASGYLLKSALRRELLETIRAVHAGRRHIPADIAQEIALHAAEEQLTARELEVLRLVAEGHANKTIGWELSLAEETVRAHLKHIFGKLGVSDRTHAVTTAMRRGMI